MSRVKSVEPKSITAQSRDEPRHSKKSANQSASRNQISENPISVPIAPKGTGNPSYAVMMTSKKDSTYRQSCDLGRNKRANTPSAL